MARAKEAKYTLDDLRQMQAFPLERKIRITQTRILEWILKTKKQCCVSFSGGKDSTILLELVRLVDESIPAVFVNTGLEFPEVRKFALSKPNVIEIRPEMNFREVLGNFGYPLISKEISLQIYTARKSDGESRRRLMGLSTFIGKDGQEQSSIYNCEKWAPLAQLPIKLSQECCKKTKEAPLKKYHSKNNFKPIVGTMASESRRRQTGWLYNGCNAFDTSSPRSAPLSFWTEQDVLRYIKHFDVEIASTYGEIVPVLNSGIKNSNGVCLKCTGRQRTGCIFCGYGAHLEKPQERRFIMLAKTHPKLYDYCMRGGQWVDNPDYNPAMSVYAEGGWLNWNPKKIWVPSKNGLGYKVMLDMVNSVYGKDFIPYN